MLRISPYAKEHKTLWNNFIATSKNGLFLFHRDYMEYHADRFRDCSLMCFEGERLIGVFPANRVEDTVESHGGLTFGGIITGPKMHAAMMLRIFENLKEYLRSQHVNKLIYKVIPHIYHTIPAEEDLYALYRNRCKLIRRDLSATVVLKTNKRPGYSKGRKWSMHKGRGLEVKQSRDFLSFMDVEGCILQTKYGVKPTHTAEEIELLSKRFPENIKLFAAYREEKMLAGVIVYESEHVAHAQYIASTDEGKEMGALDVIVDFLLGSYYALKEYFDFGISTVGDDCILNEGLMENKESYGARATVYDAYEVSLDDL